MLFLGIDTATRVGSIAVLRAALDRGAPPAPEPGRIAEEAEVLAEVSRDTGLAHGAELIALVDECLAAARVELDAIGGIAVSSGPGSFTGLRVALATAKGLSFAGDLPLVGIATLEPFAATLLPGWIPSPPEAIELPVGTVIAPCLDARKGEVYTAAFAVGAPDWSAPSPHLRRLTDDAARAPKVFVDELLELLRATGAPRVVVLGDGPERYGEIATAIGDRVEALSFARFHPRAATIARLGLASIASGRSDDRATLVPQYARASEAEIVRQRRAAQGQPR